MLRPEGGPRPGGAPGFTLVEAVVAAAAAGLAALTLSAAVQMGYFMIVNAQQQLEAQALAFDKTLEIFNTCDFPGVTLATNLPPAAVPSNSVLPPGSEIWVAIFPELAAPPRKWEVEVRVKRSRNWLGRTAVLTNDVRFRVTRYDVGRN